LSCVEQPWRKSNVLVVHNYVSSQGRLAKRYNCGKQGHQSCALAVTQRRTIFSAVIFFVSFVRVRRKDMSTHPEDAAAHTPVVAMTGRHPWTVIVTPGL